MQDEPGRTVSIWMSEEVPQLPALSTGAHADVCVVGAGIAGVTTAYCLMQEGRSVILLDDSQPGRGMTERTTAHLSHAIDAGYVEIERLHGRSGARLAAESHTAAIDWIEQTANEAGIACEFLRVDGYLCAAS
ncbi:MAG TPA: FAD-dependent oxidoreductase, partial [Nitrospira sp.]|nr:FAD-dependent oxidoreductase [Nitrospira sp.]